MLRTGRVAIALILAGLALAALAALLVRRAAGGPLHFAIIAALAVPFLPLFATTVTGDVSRHLPGWMSSDGPKDDVVLASAAATVLLAVIAAACVFAAARRLWSMTRGGV